MRGPGSATIRELLTAPPQAAVAYPPPGVCVDCGTGVEPQWLGHLSDRLGWVVAERCGPCMRAAHQAGRAETQRARLAHQREEWLRRRIVLARLTDVLVSKTFAAFRPRPGAEEALTACQSFAAAMVAGERPRGMMLVGTNGCGKSHLAAAVLNAVFADSPRLTGVYWRTYDFLDALRAGFGERGPLDASEVRDLAASVDLLVLDDIGAARIREGESGDWIREDLTRLLDRRIAEGRLLIVTTDQGRDDLLPRLGPRIVSRLYEACDVVPNTASDYRIEAAMARREEQQP